MFYTNKENENYLNFSNIDLYMLMVRNTPKSIQNEVSKILSAALKYEKKNKCSIGEMTISKDSVLGSYVVQLNDKNIFSDLIVTHKDITNAFNISVFEDNPIQKEIFPLFKNQISGDVKTLSKQYDENVISYIMKNNDFEYYLKVINGTYKPNEYRVYENGDFNNKKLSRNVKELKLKRNKK